MICGFILLLAICAPVLGQNSPGPDVSKMSDLEFASFLATGLADDFAVSYGGQKYPLSAILPLQATLLERARTGTTEDAKVFADFTQTAMAQCLGSGLTESCALIGHGGLQAIMDFIDGGKLDEGDSFFLTALLLVQSEVENENFHSAGQIAATLRMWVRLALKQNKVRDPSAAEAWDLHLKYLIGTFILPNEEILAGRAKIRGLLSNKEPNSHPELRNTLKRLNDIESARIELYKYNWSGAERILRPWAKEGDQLAQSWLALSLMYLNKYPEAGKLLMGILHDRRPYQKDFQAYVHASLALARWQAGAKDHDKAIETLKNCRMQIVLRRKIDQSVSGKELPDYVMLPFYYIYRLESASFMASGKKLEAENAALQFSTIIRIWADIALRGTTEEEQLRFKELIEDGPFTVPYLADQKRLLGDNIVFFKGLIADELAKVPIQARDVNELIVQGYDPDLARDLARLPSTEREKRNAPSLEWSDLRNALPQGVAFVDFIRCGGRLNDRGWSEPVYLAVITTSDMKNEPAVLDLGRAPEIEAKITSFLSTMRLGFDDPSAETLAKELHALLLKPVLTTIPRDTKTIIFCPDGYLSFLNFAALPDADGTFLCEKVRSYISGSARDLISKQNFQTNQKSDPLIFANPAFGEKPLPEDSRKRSFSLQPLPEADKEARAVAGSLRERGWKPRILTGNAATEKSFRESNSPPIVHLATHGFFLADIGVKNPMKASGLALAGSAKYADRAKRGVLENDPNDGILTAEEISKINLNGTWLVSVSACESGMGRSLDGEGLLGLKRGFHKAGAQNLLLCLWPIEDSPARHFTEAFYAEFGKGRDPREAHHLAMKTILGHLKKESGITSAMRNAGAFVLTSGQKLAADEFQPVAGKRLVRAEKK